jgi:formylglycine-generating enzyme required for sulfatase activity
MTATAAPTAAPEAKPPARCPDKMALVAGGTYAWGPKKENVTVADFCMDVSETTSDTYAACVKEKKCTEDFLKCAPQQTYGVAGKGNAPVVCVDLKQANDFCAYAGKRLPSEEEWEWAARGGKNGWKFPWGDDAPKDQLCWAGLGDKPKGPCDVGAHPKGDSPEGIHDLAGNVFEWTTSRNDATSPVRDGRGGSWKDGDPALLRANRAGAFQPSYRCGFLGIRCVMKAN